MTPIFHLRETPRSRYPGRTLDRDFRRDFLAIVVRFTPRNSVTVIDFIVLTLRYITLSGAARFMRLRDLAT